MKTIESALMPTDGYIVSFSRNTTEGWWELELGLPKTWAFDENDNVGCELTFDEEEGKVVRVYPKNKNIVIDDLIKFVEIIIKTNERIAEKQKEFTVKMEEMKDVLEEEAKKFYQELEDLKENSFKEEDDEVIVNSQTIESSDDRITEDEVITSKE